MSMLILKNPPIRTSSEFLSVRICSNAFFIDTLRFKFGISLRNIISCIVEIDVEEAIGPLDLGVPFLSFVWISVSERCAGFELLPGVGAPGWSLLRCFPLVEDGLDRLDGDVCGV